MFAAIAIVVVGLGAYGVLTALGTERPVGFETARVSGKDGKPFAVGVWYPTEANPRPTTFLGGVLMDVAPGAAVAGRDLPLVVISHGNGGGPGSHVDLALSLADAGYVVAAPMHTGDNYADQSAAGSVELFSGRNRELRATIDHMLMRWKGRDRLDPQRIGAYGFSAGGFTVLTAVGAKPDLRSVAIQCRQSPEFICAVLGDAKSPLLSIDAAGVGDDFVPDPRIKAAVVAAPGLGFTLVADGLTDVQVPVQLWSGEKDDKVPYASNAGLVREGLGSKVEFHPVPGAGHTSFLRPCGLLAPPALCADPGQFDRKAFHEEMNASILAFFERNMRTP